MDPFSDIDLDAAAVWLDGAWYTREALARRIKEMIEAGDFRVSRPSHALERLEAALAASRVMAVRMPSELAAAVDATAARLERPAGHLVREAIAYYLAAAEAYVAQAEAAGGVLAGGAVPVADEVSAAAAGSIGPTSAPPGARGERPGEGGAAEAADPGPAGSPGDSGEDERSA